MNPFHLLRLLVFTSALVATGALTSCGPHSGSQSSDPNVDYYTCTMHPSVHSHDPNAKCPICSMDLVPVKKKGSPQDATGTAHPTEPAVSGPQTSEFTVPVERQQQIGVTYATVEKKPLHHVIRTVGMVVPDKTRHWEFVARAEGYIQKLDVTSPGEVIEPNQPLLTLYSPELLTAEHEYLTLLESRDRASTPEGKASADKLVSATRFRLEQWNLTAQQIADLAKTRKASEFLTLDSPFKGIVEDVPVDQGRRVMTGDHLVDVADLSVVWVWAEFYEDEMSMLAKGQKAVITANAYPDQKFEGTLSLINPFVGEAKRTTKARIDIPNADFKLLPGMYVNIELGMDMGESITIPVSAVMPTGSKALVFIDKGMGKLEPKYVDLKGKFGDVYAVQDGLKEGERVVSSANFLIDAESKVQGAVKSFEEPASDSQEKPAMSQETPLPKEAGPLFGPLITSYLDLQRQLAQDKFDGVPKDVATLREQVDAITKSELQPNERTDDYRKHVAALATLLARFKTGNIGEARADFGEVSAALIALLSEFPPPLKNPVHVVNCPMWDKSPANWLQISDELQNPFMGTKMVHCGDVVKTLQGAK